MYKISDACKAALDKLQVTTRIEGTLKLNNGTVICLGNKDFSQGGLSINSKCVSGNDFEYGAVYCAELVADIQTTADRYLFYNGIISIAVYILLPDNTWEEIPMGIYNVSEVERTGQKIEIKAYDNMVLMDDPIDMSVTDITGRPFEILETIAGMADIILAQSREDIEILPNGNRLLGISVSQNATTRDVLSELCTVLCAFAVYDRAGRLTIRQYGTEQVYTATSRKKTNTKISDYMVRYKGLKAQIGGKYKYVLEDMADGLILDIGTNGFLQHGLDSMREEIMQNMRDVILAINYTPCSTELMTGYPALDLGDLIEVESPRGSSIQTYVMSYNWKYRGRHTLKGVGNNPRLNVKSQTEKTIEDVTGSVNTKDIITHSYTNISPYTLQEKEKTIISINYATAANAHPVFIATIPFTTDRDGYVIFKYYLDEVLMPDDTLRQYVSRGDHFVTLSNNLTAEKDTRHTLAVKACTEYAESDFRQQAAKITSFERYINTGKYTAQAIDTTIPKVTIAKNTIRAVLYAQGMAGTDEWDGTINISEYITPMELPRMQLSGFTLSADLAEVPREDKTNTENIAAWGMTHLPIVGLEISVAAEFHEEPEPDVTIEESEDETT